MATAISAAVAAALALWLVVALVLAPAESAHAQFAGAASPDALIKFIDSINQPSDRACVPGGRPPSDGLSPKTERVMKSAEGTKSDAELTHYLRCYQQDDGNNLKTFIKLWPTIKRAAVIFDLPPTVLACLIFRESRFDPKAESVSNAKGLTQIMDGTLEEIDLSLRIGVTASKKLPETTSTREEKKNSALGTLTLNRVSLAKRWATYAKSQKLDQKSIPVTDVSAFNPKIAIGAGAYYLRYILDYLDLDPSLDGLYVALGAYNMGPNGAIRLLKKFKPQSAKTYSHKAMKAVMLKHAPGETIGYITSIERCATSPSSNSELAYLPPIRDHRRNCFKPDYPVIAPPEGKPTRKPRARPPYRNRKAIKT